MSKSISHLFIGTKGHRLLYGEELSLFIESRKSAEEIIAERVKGLDLRTHTIKNKKMLSQREMKEIKKKIKNRTATMEEYRNFDMTKRFNTNRKIAIDDFWREEKIRIRNNSPTRTWTPEQARDILAGRKPKYKGRTIHGHHAFSAKLFPHLARKHEVIYPATYEEHLYGWHGGNWNTSIPGKRIRKIENF